MFVVAYSIILQPLAEFRSVHNLNADDKFKYLMFSGGEDFFMKMNIFVNNIHEKMNASTQ